VVASVDEVARDVGACKIPAAELLVAEQPAITPAKRSRSTRFRTLARFD
jgi:hypothetical protein